MSLLTKSYKPYTVTRRGGTTGARTDVVLTGHFYKGFIQPISGNEKFNMTKSGEDSTHRLYTDYRAGIVKGDKITDHNGREYIVVFAPLDEGITGFKKHNELLLKVFK